MAEGEDEESSSEENDDGNDDLIQMRMKILRHLWPKCMRSRQ